MKGTSTLKYRACAQNVSGINDSFLDFGMLPYTQTKGQVLSSTVPAHRMCQTPLILFTLWDAALHPDKGTSALKYRACAQNVSSVTTVFPFWDAGSHHDEGPSALKHRAW